MMELIPQSNKKKRTLKSEYRKKKSEYSLRNLWDNRLTFSSQKFQRREKMSENSLEDIMAENFLNLGKKTDIQIHKAQGIPQK